MYKTLILLLTCLISAAHGQGKIVTTAGDTYTGKVSIDIPSQYFESVTIKTEEDKFTFKAHEVLEIYKDDKKYVPIWVDNRYKIMRVDSEGYVGLFSYREGSAYDFGYRYLYKRDGSGIPVPNLGFRNSLSKYMEDCPELAEDIKSGKYKKGELDKILTEYNQCIDRNTLKSKLEVGEVIDAENPAIAKIEEIKETTDNDELITLLSDIQTKVAQGKAIPGYLLGALRDYAQTSEALSTDIGALIEMLQ